MLLAGVEDALRVPGERAVEAVETLRAEVKAAAKRPRSRRSTPAALAERAGAVDGAKVVTEVVDATDAKALMDIADRVKGKLGDTAAIVLGTVVDGRVHLVAAVTPGARAARREGGRGRQGRGARSPAAGAGDGTR